MKWIELHRNISYPFISVVMALLAIPLSIRSSRHGGILFCVGVNLAMGFVFSFLYAMMVACATLDERVTARWAEGEATRADKLLGNDSAIFETVATTYLSNIQSEERGGEIIYSIPLTDFIELSPRISGDYWRLPNRPMKEGWVEMGPSNNENSQQR